MKSLYSLPKKLQIEVQEKFGKLQQVEKTQYYFQEL
jgi:hypothetical protein